MNLLESPEVEKTERHKFTIPYWKLKDQNERFTASTAIVVTINFKDGKYTNYDINETMSERVHLKLMAAIAQYVERFEDPTGGAPLSAPAEPQKT